MKYALIRTAEDTVYASPVLGLRYDPKGEHKALVFNRGFTRLKSIPLFRGNKRMVYVYREVEERSVLWDGWICSKRIADNAALMKRLRHYGNVSVKRWPMLLEYAQRPSFPGWLSVESEKDVETLNEYLDPLFTGKCTLEGDVAIVEAFGVDTVVTLRMEGVTDSDQMDSFGLDPVCRVQKTEGGFLFTLREENSDALFDEAFDEPVERESSIRCERVLWRLDLLEE